MSYWSGLSLLYIYKHPAIRPIDLKDLTKTTVYIYVSTILQIKPSSAEYSTDRFQALIMQTNVKDVSMHANSKTADNVSDDPDKAKKRKEREKKRSRRELKIT